MKTKTKQARLKTTHNDWNSTVVEFVPFKSVVLNKPIETSNRWK